jgi:hypothetical protein
MSLELSHYTCQRTPQNSYGLDPVTQLRRALEALSLPISLGTLKGLTAFAKFLAKRPSPSLETQYYWSYTRCMMHPYARESNISLHYSISDTLHNLGHTQMV